MESKEMKTEQRVINRVIKFRAWDKLTTRMSPAFQLFGEFLLFGAVHDWQREAGKGPTLERLNDLEIMQFTGLVDKEGNEIYEWDLVKDSAPWVWTVRFGEIISDGIRYVGWYLEHPEREDFSGPFTSEDTSVLKIVGNTFQGLLPSTTTI